jgi:uncharacterized membrane protein HdeD (DUF308 family)
MLKFAAWFLLVLGIAHIFFGIVRFEVPVRAAVAEGFVGKFGDSDTRRLAFWFILAGPMLMLAGQIALHAIDIGDLRLIRLIGIYLAAIAIVGVMAFPKSPLWILFLPAPIFIAAGYRWIAS